MPSFDFSTIGVTKFLVQDSWNEEDDQELLDCLAASGVPFETCSVPNILQQGISPTTMIFADSSVMQQLLVHEAVDTYSDCFQDLYKRAITRGHVSQLLTQELPVFVKPAGTHKLFAAQVVHTRDQGVALVDEVGASDDSCFVYVAPVVDFSSEHRLFIGEDRIWAVREYSEYMIGHRLTNKAHGAEILSVEDIALPIEFANEVLDIVVQHEMGFVVVDCGYNPAKDEWCVVEVNPPFALSSYDMDINDYVKYCCKAWAHTVQQDKEKEANSS